MKRTKCANCRKRLFVGNDCHSYQRGVLGTRGFVPLKDREVFCSEECLSLAYSGMSVEEPRVP